MKKLILILMMLVSFTRAQISNQTATDSIPTTTLFLVSQFYGGQWHSHKLTAETLQDSILASLGTGSITTVHILNNTIQSEDILDLTITGADIANNSLTEGKFSGSLLIDGILHTLVKDTIDMRLPLSGGTMTGNITFNSTQTIDGITHSLVKDSIDAAKEYARTDYRVPFGFEGSYISSDTADSSLTMSSTSKFLGINPSAGNIPNLFRINYGAGLESHTILLTNTHATNTVTFKDEQSIYGTTGNLSLSGDFVMGEGDVLALIYSSNLSKWLEISRSNN